VAVTVQPGKKITLFVNGVKDSSAKHTVQQAIPEASVRVGGSPATSDKCDMPLLIDNLAFYAKKISRASIAADSFPSLGNVEPGFVLVGCKG